MDKTGKSADSHITVHRPGEKRPENTAYCYFDSPVGLLKITEDKAGICGIEFTERSQDGNCPVQETGSRCASSFLDQAVRELKEYFAGTRKKFTIPLSLYGTAFRIAVWQALLEIPCGETRSYREIAQAIGNPGACRAVGMANHENPVAIVVPCHRVIGADGSLTGYGGGLSVKEQLLKLEKSV